LQSHINAYKEWAPMKTPCEIIVWYVLPVIRKEVAKELIQKYNIKQSEVARLFGVTDAAVSQYMNKKRGGGVMIENSQYYGRFLKEIRYSSKVIVEGKSDISKEMCRVCTIVKKIGLLTEVYKYYTGVVIHDISEDDCTIGNL